MVYIETFISDILLDSGDFFFFFEARSYVPS